MGWIWVWVMKFVGFEGMDGVDVFFYGYGYEYGYVNRYEYSEY